MPKILIVYASDHGHTAKIASRIAETLRAGGVAADLRGFGAGAELSPPDYDAVVVGASIHAGHHQRDIVDWTKHHAATLNGMPSAFFSVSLAAADETEESARETRKYIDDFLDETGWTPRRAVPVAGALEYREYDFTMRLVMRLLMARGGRPTDVSQDYDYTDWAAVDRFAHECAELADRATAGRAR